MGMRLSGENTKKLCLARCLSLNALLKRAGVSKTAYYHLIDKESVLPRSIDALAAALGVRPSALLEESDRKARRALRLLETADRIAGSDPSMDRDNVRHTLLLLEEKPIDRLQRSLLRARDLDRIIKSKEAVGRPKDLLVLPVLRDTLKTLKLKRTKRSPAQTDS